MIRAAWSLACVALATGPMACGPATPTPAPVVPRPGTAVVVGARPATPTPAPVVVRSAPTRGLIEAPHGGAVTTLAVTADGQSAVSCDELGGVRLWPVLDGSREPRIVDLPRPRELAIGGDPRGFLLAMIDDVGGVVLQVVDRDGLLVQRVSLAGDPAFLGVEMTARGPLAWRADQMLVRLRTDGTLASQLPAEAGQRIVALAVGGDRAIAVIEAGTPAVQRARWITLGDTLAWGPWVDAATRIGRVVALSPSGKRLATLAGEPSPQVSVIDTATGKLVANEALPAVVSVGMIDDVHVALATADGIAWLDLAAAKPGPQPQATGASDVREQGILGTGGGRAIGASNGELMLATPTRVEFLGYALESPAVVAAGPEGRLLIGVGDTFALLDRELHAVAAPAIGVGSGAAVASLLWLAGDDWLVEASQISDGSATLSLVDVAKGRSQVIKTGMPIVQIPMFETSTGLVTLSLGNAPDVSRYDRAHHRLDRLAAMPKPKGYEQTELAPVVPALAGGTQLVVAQMRDRMTLRWLRDPAVLDRGTTITVDGSLAAVDRAGRVYVWQTTKAGGLELAIYAGGKRTGTLPTDGPVVLYPDPTATRILAVGQRSASLLGADGVARWSLAVEGVTEALWLDDGALAVISAAGLARLDAATGKVLAARCGWRFGLTSKQHPVSPRVEPVCAQLR